MSLTPRIDRLDKNYIINGNFDFWQRGTSHSTSGYGSADRFISAHNGSTKTFSRQSFGVGQTDVPGNPTYFSRTVVTSVAGAGNYVVNVHKIESVAKLAGKAITISFYAKADASKSMSVEVNQNFGVGGSPSTQVDSVILQKVNLTTSWQKFVIQGTIPSIAGKTLGTTHDGYTEIALWLDAGSSLNSRTLSLGNQSGTFDIASIQLIEGTYTDPEFTTAGRNYAEELQLCMRYYERHTGVLSLAFDNANSTTSGQVIWQYKVKKRANATNAVGSSVAANSRYYGPSGLRGISTFVTGGISNIDAGGFTATLASAAVQYQGGTVAIIANGATDYLDADAEL